MFIVYESKLKVNNKCFIFKIIILNKLRNHYLKYIYIYMQLLITNFNFNNIQCAVKIVYNLTFISFKTQLIKIYSSNLILNPF